MQLKLMKGPVLYQVFCFTPDRHISQNCIIKIKHNFQRNTQSFIETNVKSHHFSFLFLQVPREDKLLDEKHIYYTVL